MAPELLTREALRGDENIAYSQAIGTLLSMSYNTPLHIHLQTHTHTHRYIRIWLHHVGSSLLC